ncbi:MAG TPA: PHP domain-containing protein [Armatimonadota bacterium]|nr:PHP domain-containing protein [Armatimonadota bacterium]
MKKYDGTLWVGTGVEVAEYMFDPTHAEQIMNLTDYDVIIGSVHSIAYDNWDSYSRTNFDVTVPREKILTYLKRYFAEMQRMIECAHINVLAHITCPFRYINGKYGRNIDVSIFAEQIEQILHDIIDKGIALELNTSGLNIGWGEFMPSREILACYSRLGGELITLGSDAHISQNVGGGLKDGLALLQEVGYKYYASYCNKKIRMIRIEDSSRFAEMY